MDSLLHFLMMDLAVEVTLDERMVVSQPSKKGWAGMPVVMHSSRS